MRIGIDCRLWGETGVGRYIRNLVLNLQIIDKKNEYKLFILNKNKAEILEQIQNNRFKIVETNIRWHTLGEQIMFPAVLNKENLDLVHFPYFSIPIFYKRPFVVTIHDLIIDHFPTGLASNLPKIAYGLKWLGYKIVLARAAKIAKKIIAVSSATKDEIIGHLKINPQKITVTYEGVDNKISNSPTSLKLRGASKFQNYFLYVGNAYPHKNLERLLEAFKRLSIDDINLVLVGKEDEFYRRLKDRVQEMNLANKIIFLQNVSDEELSSLYKNTIALILPSLMEGFGLSALEAMASNCLVLASKIPSLQEICGDSAIYFDPSDVSDIAEKIKEALEGNNYKIKEKALERVKLFSWQKMAKETLKVYESCISL